MWPAIGNDLISIALSWSLLRFSSQNQSERQVPAQLTCVCDNLPGPRISCQARSMNLYAVSAFLPEFLHNGATTGVQACSRRLLQSSVLRHAFCVRLKCFFS